MGKKRKRGDLVKFPVRRIREAQTAQERKLSEIVKEMALRLLKEPDAVPLPAAAEAALLLATGAWNDALGAAVFREQDHEMLKKLERGEPSSRAELLSRDTDRLIAGLVEYKKAHYPNDRRHIVAAGMNPEGNVQVHWVEENKLVTASFGFAAIQTTIARAENG